MLKTVSLGLIDFYRRYIRVLLPVSCRFDPSCSQYAGQAIQKYGFHVGIMKGVKRLLRCHPFCGNGGYDPLL